MQCPEPVVTWLEDGSVEIRVGAEIGWVTSGHLIEDKAIQLKLAWYRAQGIDTP